MQDHVPGAVPDLPKELALLDIENTLPKLSVLPSVGREYVPRPMRHYSLFILTLAVRMSLAHGPPSTPSSIL